MKNWDKILDNFAHKCGDGGPDMTNPRHLALLRESLIKFGWKENATNEFIGNLRETKDKSDDGWWTKMTPAQQAKYIKDHPGSEKAQEAGAGKGEPKKKETATQKKSREAQEQHDKDQKKVEEVHKELYGEGEEGQLIGGDTGPNDTQTKNEVIKHGYKGLEGAIGKKPAPGNEGSAFNEILSGEGAEILEKHSDLSEQELAKVLSKQFCGTALGQENSNGKKQKKATPDIPEGVDQECYKKCLVAARSAKRKHQRAQNIKDNLGPDGEGILGEETETTQFYGADESLDAQCEAIDNAKTVYAPDGTEIPKESTWTPSAPTRDPGPPKEPYRDYHKRVKKWAKETGAKRTETGALDMAMEGGGGENPSDTATFIKDENGNLVIAFASDKMTTNDIQANSSIVNEINQKIQWIKDDPHLTKEEKKELIAILEKNKKKIIAIESQLKGNLGALSDSISDLKPGSDGVTESVVTMLDGDILPNGDEDPQKGTGRGTSKYWKGKNGVVQSYGPGARGYLNAPKKKRDENGKIIKPVEWVQEVNKNKKDQLYYLAQTEVEGDVPGYYPNYDKKTTKNKAQYYSQNPPGEEEILAAILAKTKHGDPDRPLTDSEAKLIERLSRRMVDHYRELAKNPNLTEEERQRYLDKAKEWNIAEKTEQVRREAVKEERRQLAELNGREITLPPDGKKKPLGDYLEAQNLVDKLHLSQMNGEDAHGVYKYDGLMEVNMGGVVVNPEVLEKCLDSATSGEVIEDFEVDNPGPDEELSRSTDEFETDKDGNAWYWAEPGTGSHESDPNGTPQPGGKKNMTTNVDGAKKNKSGKPMAVGRVTGRNIFIYAVTKGPPVKRIPIATKTLRSKTGKLGKFQTVYQWSPEIQECFKDNEPPKNEPVEKK